MVWGNTEVTILRLGLVQDKMIYAGRPIIHRDSSIDGGVFLGGRQREAIVVDFEKDCYLKEIYEKAKREILEKDFLRKERALPVVYETVDEAMPIRDEKELNRILDKYNLWKDKKVQLGIFINEGVGVCRHCTLACAAILERFKKENIIQGKASVDRSMQGILAHAWCRYTNSGGKVFILDVSNKYLGPLEENINKANWDYRRPGEIK